MKRRNVSLLARLLLVAIGAAPFAPALFAHVPALGGLARALDAWFSFQCERDPQRMLGVGAVCARCLGLYVGLGLGALVGRPRWPTPRLEIWLGLAVIVLLADVVSERFGWRAPSAPLRLVTGFAVAYPAGVLVVAWLNGVRLRPGLPREQPDQNP